MSERNTKKNLLMGLTALIGVIVVVAVIGYIVAKPKEIVLQGEAEATEYRISGKIPGRIEAYYAELGEQVKQGDTLVLIDSPELKAKLAQVNGALAAAQAQNRKAINGARQEQIMGAYEMWQKAKIGEDVMEKSYMRVKRLFEKEVISAQKMDEAEAKYKAAVATAKAAKSQYDMALNGADKEDKAAAQALVDRAEGALMEVNSFINETVLTAPASGELCEIFHNEGELVGTGAPIMSIVDLNDMWFSFNVREDLLDNMTVGSIIEVKIPALGMDKTYKAKVTFMKSMASYATWRATKVNGQFDAKTFELRAKPVEKIAGLRLGMSAIINSVLE